MGAEIQHHLARKASEFIIFDLLMHTGLSPLFLCGFVGNMRSHCQSASSRDEIDGLNMFRYIHLRLSLQDLSPQEHTSTSTGTNCCFFSSILPSHLQWRTHSQF